MGGLHGGLRQLWVTDCLEALAVQALGVQGATCCVHLWEAPWTLCCESKGRGHKFREGGEAAGWATWAVK